MSFRRAGPSLLAVLLAGLAASQTIPDTTKCGQGMGCLHYSTSCVSENCSAIVTWRKSDDPNYLYFEMTAVTVEWVAIGLSSDTLMGDDGVTDCIWNGSTVAVGFSYNYFTTNTPYSPSSSYPFLKNASGSYSNGRISCTFLRSINTDNGWVLPLNRYYYLLLASGPASGGTKQRHRIDPQVSPVLVNVMVDFVDVSNLEKPASQPVTPPPSVSSYPCMQPTNCVTDGVNNQVTFAVLPGGDQVLITLTSQAVNGSGWVALGFSNDMMMGADVVIDCILAMNGTITVKHSYNIVGNNIQVQEPTAGIVDVNRSYSNGVLQCSLKQNVSFPVNGNNFNLSKPYYLLLANGPVNSQGVKTFHAHRYATNFAVDVTSNFSMPVSRYNFSDDWGNVVSFGYMWNSSQVEFEIQGPVSGNGKWISLGFSTDLEMGEDSVVDCLLFANGSMAVEHSYNYNNNMNKWNAPLYSTEGIMNTWTSYQNGTLDCSFKRNVGGFQNPQIFPLDKAYYLFLGHGWLNDNGTKQKHDVMPAESDMPVDVRTASSNVVPRQRLAPGSTTSPVPGGPGGIFLPPDSAAEVHFMRSADGDSIEFLIKGPAPQTGRWIAVGFSYDSKMGDDSVLDCILLQNGTFVVQNSYNDEIPRGNNVVGSEGITKINTSRADGNMTCSCERKIEGFSDPRIFSLNQTYYLLLAYGNVNDSGFKQYHGSNQRFASNVLYNLSSTVPTTTSAPAAPGSFSSTDGKHVVQYRLSSNGNTVEFTITGETQDNEHWVSVGFSHDQSMGDDSVLDCILLKNGTFVVQNSYNEIAKNNHAVGSDGITMIKTSHADGKMTCSFERKIEGFSNPQIFSLNQTYYLLLAYGNVEDNGDKAKHDARFYSNDLVNPTVGSISSGDARRYSNAPDPDRLLRAHGVLMITAFVMLLCGAVIIARYYRTCWSEKKICGTAVWFAVHRFLMVIGLFCCAAGFIIIFCYGDGHIYRNFSEGSPYYYWVHGPLGIVVMILIIMNPIIALFRCDPDNDKRWIFNWLHWAVGTSCQILAGITLFFGIEMGEQYYFINHISVFWILIAFVAFHFVIEFVLIVEKIITLRQNKQSFTVSYGMSSPGEEPTAVKQDIIPTKESLVFRYFVLAVYALVTMGLWLAMIILIGGSFHAKNS